MAVEECPSHHTAPDIHHVILFTLYTKKLSFSHRSFLSCFRPHSYIFCSLSLHSMCALSICQSHLCICTFGTHITCLTSTTTALIFISQWLIILWAAVTTHTATLSFTFLIHCVLHLLHFYCAFPRKVTMKPPLNTAIASDNFGGNLSK